MNQRWWSVVTRSWSPLAEHTFSSRLLIICGLSLNIDCLPQLQHIQYLQSVECRDVWIALRPTWGGHHTVFDQHLNTHINNATSWVRYSTENPAQACTRYETLRSTLLMFPCDLVIKLLLKRGKASVCRKILRNISHQRCSKMCWKPTVKLVSLNAE